MLRFVNGALLALTMTALPAAITHPGDTDSMGCHVDRRTGARHCH